MHRVQLFQGGGIEIVTHKEIECAIIVMAVILFVILVIATATV